MAELQPDQLYANPADTRGRNCSVSAPHSHGLDAPDLHCLQTQSGGIRITAGPNFLEQPWESILEGFIYWFSAVIGIWFLPLVNFFLQNTHRGDWESFSDSADYWCGKLHGDSLTCAFPPLSLICTSPSSSVPPEKRAFPVSRWGSRVSAAHRWCSDWWLAVLPLWPGQRQKLLSNLSHLWQPLSREMRQPPWHKGFWPGVKNSFRKKKIRTLYRPHCFPFILWSGPSIPDSTLAFRH